MADVINFPGTPLAAAESDRVVEERREFQLDCGYAAEALNHIAGLRLDTIATHVVLAVDAARHGRRFDPDYDETRRGGVIGVLSRMIRGPEAVDEPELPEPPECA